MKGGVKMEEKRKGGGRREGGGREGGGRGGKEGGRRKGGGGKRGGGRRRERKYVPVSQPTPDERFALAESGGGPLWRTPSLAALWLYAL